ncbi:MAG: hypothetical protein RLY21_1001 [Planctomycetota bacterium]|jgi:hypothetical protein
MAERRNQSNRPALAFAARGGSSLSEVVSQGYFDASRRPLEILFFLLPFIALYEYELVRVLRSPEGLVTNGAHLGILRLFDALGFDAAALSLPGLLLVAILVGWHAAQRGPWIVDLGVVGRMYLESAALVVPLLVLAQVAVRALPLAGVDDFGALPLGARIAVSIGAGIYEELVFRLLLIWVLLAALVDFAKFSRKIAVAIAVGLSALAFTVYHPLHAEDGSLIAQRFAFYFAAGVYFGAVFLLRGFGIVVATHALYDIATALLAARAADAPPG